MTTPQTIDQAAKVLVALEMEAVLAVQKATAAYVKALESVDANNRAGTNTGNMLSQIVNQAKNNAGQLENLVKDVDLRLNPVTENFGGTNGGITPAPARL